MIVIRKIDVIEVPENWHTFATLDHPDFRKAVYMENAGVRADIEIKKEDVFCKRFVNTRGQIVCIGARKEVQDAIGLPFEVFETQQNKIQELQRDLEVEIYKIQRIAKLNFFQRLKFAFIKKDNEKYFKNTVF